AWQDSADSRRPGDAQAGRPSDSLCRLSSLPAQRSNLARRYLLERTTPPCCGWIAIPTAIFPVKSWVSCLVQKREQRSAKADLAIVLSCLKKSSAALDVSIAQEYLKSTRISGVNWAQPPGL